MSGPLSDQTETIRVSLENYGTGAAAQLRSMTSPEETEAAATIADEKLRDCYTGTISALGEFNGNTATELSGLFEELRANLASIVGARCSAATETGAAMGQTLRETSKAGVTAMEYAALSFQERLSAGLNDAIQEMASSGAQFRSQTRQAHEDAMSKFAQLIDDGFSSEDNLITDARSEISSAAEEIAGKYAELKSEAEHRSAAEEEAPATRIHRGIWDTITGFAATWSLL